MTLVLTTTACVTLSLKHAPLRDQDQLRTLLHPENDLGDTDRPHWWFATTAEAFRAYPIAGGWMIEISDPYAQDAEGTLDLFSRRFVDLLKWAHTNDFGWLRLDREAPINRGVPLG